MSWVPPKSVPSYWVGQGMPKKIEKRKITRQYSPCTYCGNDFQQNNALNCHGCGAPLKYEYDYPPIKVITDNLSGYIDAAVVFSEYLTYRENQ